MLKLVQRYVAPVARRIGNLACRGIVGVVDSASKMQVVQVALLAGEVKDGLEHFEPYGFTSRPHTSSEAVALFFGGDKSHGVVIAVSDRRYRLTGLEDGEVALYDDLGQNIKLGRDGIQIATKTMNIALSDSGVSIDAGSSGLTITNASLVRMETSRLEVTGEIVAPDIHEGSVS